MQTLADLIARTAQPGRLDWIGLRSERLVELTAVDRAEVTETGLVGDHSRGGKRAVTLIQAEHLAAIGAYLGQGPVPVALLRRNLLVSGLNLSALRGRTLQIGTTQLGITGPCAPCSRMETALGHGGYSAMRGHGGWCARVLEPGHIETGNSVTPL